MKTKKKTRVLRVLLPIAILVISGVGFAVGHAGIGSLSAIGWRDVSLICPVGAIASMLAAKIMMPRAIVSLAIAIILVVLLGRAFCGWICPVPVVSKIRDLFSKGKAEESHVRNEPRATEAATNDELTEEEKELLLAGCGGNCAAHHGVFDARHMVLGGGLLSAAIFGFPVFCLICPVGLTFATVFLLIRAFGFGDVSLLFVLAPLFLVLEVVVFRRWCHTFCPISAFMSLVGLANRTLRPTIDDKKCFETGKGVSCGRCGQICSEGIDLRHPELGNGMNECTRCRECVETCPAGAISMPLLSKASKKANDSESISVEVKN